MGLVYALLVIASLIAILFVATHLRPLTGDEVTHLARKRRGDQIRRYFTFQAVPVGVNPEFKSRMNADGKFYRINDNLFDFPARVAGLLKYKKHEWVVVGFEKDKVIDLIWLNKGFNSSGACINIPISEIAELTRKSTYRSVLVFHNHPNPDPNRYDCRTPSELDMRTAKKYAEALNPEGVNVLKFICERGRFYEYSLCPADHFLPLTGFIFQLNQLNGQSRFTNLRLHWERIF